MRFVSLPCRVTLVAAFLAAAGVFAQAAAQPTTAPWERMSPSDRASAELQVANQELQIAQDHFSVAAEQFKDLRAKIQKLSGRFEVSGDALQSDASHYDKELESLQLESVGAKARRDAIEKAIKEQSDQAKTALHDDPVAGELQKVVDARQQQAKFVEAQTKMGTATHADLNNVQATLAEAQAKLAERQQTAAAASGADNLASLNRELATLMIAEDERQAKIDFLKGRLEKLRPLLEMTDDLQERERDLAMAREEYHRAQQQAEDDRMQAQRNEILNRLEAERARENQGGH